MLKSQLDNLPVLKSFKGLKRGDAIYSKQYGIGKVTTLYDDGDIIAEFSEHRVRLRLLENALSQIPIEPTLHKNNKMKISVDGESISFKAFKKMRKMEREKERILRQLKALEQR